MRDVRERGQNGGEGAIMSSYREEDDGRRWDLWRRSASAPGAPSPIPSPSSLSSSSLLVPLPSLPLDTVLCHFNTDAVTYVQKRGETDEGRWR